jgi:hypothetical protein
MPDYKIENHLPINFAAAQRLAKKAGYLVNRWVNGFILNK